MRLSGAAQRFDLGFFTGSAVHGLRGARL